MRGKTKKIKSYIIPESKYNSIILARFINLVMRQGKKIKAANIVYRALDQIEKKTKKSGLEVLELAIKNAGPPLEVRPRRIGGANYQIPMEVSRDRRTTLAMRWIINAARDRQGKPAEDLLAEEILNAYHKTGIAIKKRDDLLRMAEANRAFAHYARM